jgi:cyclase
MSMIRGGIVKKLTVLGLAVVVSVLCQQAVHADQGLQRISDCVYSYAGVQGAAASNSFGANAGIIIGQDYLVAVDSLMSAREAQRFMKDIRKISKKPVKFIISQENDQKNMQKAGAGMLQYAKQSGLTDQDLKGTRLAYPTLTFKERLTLDLGNKKIEIHYPGPSHTTGSVLVYVPQEKVLFTGDILFTDFHPFLGEANIEGWEKVLDAIMAMDVEKIIPGHGPISSKKDVAEMKSYLSVFDQKAKELTAQSQDLNFIAAEMKKSLPPRAQLDSLIARNIQMKYLAPGVKSQPKAN